MALYYLSGTATDVQRASYTTYSIQTMTHPMRLMKFSNHGTQCLWPCVTYLSDTATDAQCATYILVRHER